MGKRAGAPTSKMWRFCVLLVACAVALPPQADIASLTSSAEKFGTSAQTLPHSEIMDDIKLARVEGGRLGKLYNAIKKAKPKAAAQMLKKTDAAGFSLNDWYKANEKKKIKGVTIPPKAATMAFDKKDKIMMELAESNAVPPVGNKKRALQKEVEAAAQHASKTVEAEELDLAAYEIMRSNVLDKIKEVQKLEGK